MRELRGVVYIMRSRVRTAQYREYQNQTVTSVKVSNRLRIQRQVNKQKSQNELMENVNVDILYSELLARETGSLDILSLKKEANLPASKYKYSFKIYLNDVKSRTDF